MGYFSPRTVQCHAGCIWCTPKNLKSFFQKVTHRAKLFKDYMYWEFCKLHSSSLVLTYKLWPIISTSNSESTVNRAPGAWSQGPSGGHPGREGT